MAAQNTDLLMEVSISSATTLDSPGYTIGDTSITVVSVSTWPTATGITFAMDEVDAAGVQVAGTYNEYVGVKASATSITNVSHQNGTNQNYTAGATTRVYIPVSAERENRIVEWGLTEHEQDGTHAVELITSRTEDTNPDPDADFLLTYDTSASALKKVKPSNLSGGITGWTSNILPSVSSVTNNGNRSYDVTFGSTVASYLTPGMRVRTSRTVAAPTQCTSLNGTTQYYNKTSPNKSTFTDDFNAGGWVKLSSYPSASAGVISRWNGTSGWVLYVLTNGTVALYGYNGGAGNVSNVVSYQSIPLNKWVHIGAQLDMSAFTATTTTSYIMIDGVDVPASVARSGTNPTALVQAGDLNVGANNSTGFFPGKIAQAFFTTAKVTQAQIRSEYMCQTISASATNLGSAYSFNNSITDLNTTTPNDLTAQGSAVATATDSPFTVDANGVVGGTYDFGIVTKVATTVATVQVPEGCTIPTSGGVSAVDLSSVKSPYGFPAQRGRWQVETIYKISSAQTTPTVSTYYNIGSAKLTVPTGDFSLTLNVNVQNDSTASAAGVTAALSTSTSSLSDDNFKIFSYTQATDTGRHFPQTLERQVNTTTATAYYLIMAAFSTTSSTMGFLGSSAPMFITAEPNHL